MGFFESTGEDGSIFKDPVALDYDYQPKLVPFREHLQQQIAACIRPLFSRQNGRNVVVHGPPGIGKTVATRHVLSEINEKTDDIIPIYVNCWKKNTSYKILVEICDLIGYRFTQNKNTRDLFQIVKDKLNKYSVVFCFDEADKLEDFDFLYFILEDIYRSSIVLITNYKTWHAQLDERIHSRLTAEMCEFHPYTNEQITSILRQRMQYAFGESVWNDEAFSLAAQKTVLLRDVRSGLYLLREAGNAAEDVNSSLVNKEHVMKAIAKLDDFTIKDVEQLQDESQAILALVKQNSGNKIGDLFGMYQEQGGESSYKSFARRIKQLTENGFVSSEKSFGAGGNTTIIKYKEEIKKLTDF